ncbi:uncharacterized protein [Amphiura filiformis]|uniref:uncharacterized protein n=1 Tax=Amphiura filiformis TaxID=82378 RepID=UPI003B2159F1
MPQRLNLFLDAQMEKSVQHDCKDLKSSQRLISIFASPEAAAAKELLNKGDDEENDNKQNDSVDYGIDIPLSEFPLRKGPKEKAQAGLEEIINNYSTPNVKPKIAVSRWRKATLCASICNKLEKEMRDEKLKKVKQLAVPQGHQPPRSPSPNRTAKTMKQLAVPDGPKPPRSPSPNRSAKTMKQLAVPEGAKPPRSQSPNRSAKTMKQLAVPGAKPPRSQSPNRSAMKQLAVPEGAKTPRSPSPNRSAKTVKQLVVPEGPKPPRSPSPNRMAKTVRPGRAIVPQLCNQRDEEVTEQVISQNNGTLVMPSKPVQERNNEIKHLEIESQHTDANGNDSVEMKSDEPSSCGGSESDVCLQSRSSDDNSDIESAIRLRHRFGRRFSLPTSSLSTQLLPTPPSLANFQKALESRPSSARIHLAGRNQTKSATPSSPRCPSLTLNLQTNRAIVTELIQERSTTISNLNVSKSTGSDESSNEDACSIQSKSSGRMPPRQRLLNRRASLACTSSLKEFSEKFKLNTEETMPQEKSSSLDSINELRRRPTPIAEFTEYVELTVQDIEIAHEHDEDEGPISDEIKVLSVKQVEVSSFPELETRFASSMSSDSGIGSSDDCLNRQSSRTLHSGMTPDMPKNWRRGRRMSMPCIGNAQRNRQEVMFIGASAKLRSDAQIVQNVEEEIQQRILKRKQQMTKEQGGGATLQRMHDRAISRTAGVRLRKAMADLNNKRTTAELLQMDAAKNAAKLDKLEELTLKVKNIIKDKDSE